MKILTIIAIAIIIYFAIFFMWLLLALDCMENHTAEVCRDNVMSDIILKTHKPFINLIK
jgi:hypothetical protein